MSNRDWLECAFSEAIDFQEGPGILAQDFRPSGVPLVRLSGLTRGARVLDGCNYLDPELVERRWGHFRLKRGDILLSTSASLGRIATVDDEAEGAIPYTGIIRMRPARPDLDAPFIQFLLESPDFQHQVEAAGVGSVIRHFGPMHLRRMTVRLPSLAEQRAISRILGALDDKIDLNRRTSETLEAMARALFKSWFVDFDPVRAKKEGRKPEGMDAATAALFPDDFEESELGPIPRGWKLVHLDEFISLQRGNTYKSALLGSDGPVLLGLATIKRNGGFRSDSLRRYSGDSPEKLIVRTGELYVSLKDVTQSADLLGSVARVPRNVGVGRLTQDTVKLVFDKAAVPVEYVYRLLLTESYREYCHGRAIGTTNLALSRDDFLSFRCVVPEADVLERLIAPIAALSARAELTDETNTLVSLRDALLPKLLSGELRVPEAERIVAEAV